MLRSITRLLLWRSDHVILVALIAAATIGGVVLVLVPSSQTLFINEKAWEITTQFLVVAILGGAVALVYRRWETAQAIARIAADRASERRLAERGLLEEFYRSLVAVHRQYKKIRRTLRASSLDTPRRIRRDAFETLLDAMEDCQLKVEALRREVQLSGALFGPETELIDYNLGIMDGYLRCLLGGYEEDYGTRHMLASSELVTMDERLCGFVERLNGSDGGAKALFEAAHAVEGGVLRQLERTIPK